MSQLRLCDGCSRHVLISEQTCPFCACELMPALQRALPTPRAGLSRGQRLMLTAAIAGQTLAACAETTHEPELLADGGATAGNAGRASAAGQGTIATGGTGGDASRWMNIAPPYGLAPTPPPPPPPPPNNRKDAGPLDQDAGADDAGTD
jgi:hypothetical protein